ncbi:MAG: hypothetical protein K0Q59_3219 [Paenibacillus sp.]|jgi:two-component SAPR family response regulator|nr:hypothetical protein [Paenibacillus sp.]
MKAFIVDDEQPAIDMLHILLEEDGRIEVIGTYRKPMDALEGIITLKPDVVFLDIQMPLMNGLELAEHMLELDSALEIVFVTAYDHYALEAFKVNAIDYLLKPVAETGLKRSLSRLFKRKHVPASAPAPRQPAISIRCFGGFDVMGNEPERAVIAWRTVKAQELMAYLFLKRGKEISKWQLIEDIWPNCSLEQVHSNLHTTIYQVRKTLRQYGVHAAIHFRNAHYRLEATGLSSDVEQFIRLFAEEAPITAANAQDYEQCLHMYKGDLFGAWGYFWSLPEREKLKQQYASLTKQLCSFYMQAGQFASAVQPIQKLIAMQPLDEEAYEILLQLDIRMNNRAAFFAHYRQLEHVLQTELGIAPNEHNRQLYDHWSIQS